MNDRIDAFLAHVSGERQLADNTISAYRNDLHQFGEFLAAEAARQGGGAVALSSIDRQRLAGFLLHLHERGYAPATVARKVAALKTFFHYLRRSGEIAADPTESLEAPEVKKLPPRAISPRDVRTLLAHAQRRLFPEAYRDSAMLRVLYATGMRVSELIMLDVSDVHLDACTVRVVGRRGRERVLPLDELTARSLRTYLGEGRPLLMRHAPEQTALFLNHRGQRLTRQGFWLILKALVKDSGLAVLVTPHTLRHSFARHRLGEGVALEQLRQLLGHASIATTQIYTQLSGGEGDDPALAPVAPTQRKHASPIGSSHRPAAANISL